MVPSMVNINFGKYKISQRPAEAMLFVMVKHCLHYQICLFSTVSNDYFFLYMDSNRMGNINQHYSVHVTLLI